MVRGAKPRRAMNSADQRTGRRDVCCRLERCPATCSRARLKSEETSRPKPQYNSYTAKAPNYQNLGCAENRSVGPLLRSGTFASSVISSTRWVFAKAWNTSLNVWSLTPTICLRVTREVQMRGDGPDMEKFCLPDSTGILQGQLFVYFRRVRRTSCREQYHLAVNSKYSFPGPIRPFSRVPPTLHQGLTREFL